MIAIPTGISYLQPTLGAMLAITEVIFITATGLTLLVTIVRGTPEPIERIFRLLRMITNRPEPPSATQQTADQQQSH